jgi:hypothetical protein
MTWARRHNNEGGILHVGQSIDIKGGEIFSAADTSNA